MTSKIFKSPLVSVLMPAYNREKYIGEAIESVLVQTYTHWELIIVDDGSTDSTVEIVKSYQAKDGRIILHQFPENKGIPYARNQCLELAKGEYLANLDSDDIALPQRLEKQVQFMEENPEVGICGTWLDVINYKNDKIGTYKMPTEHSSIVFNLVFASYFLVNTSVIMRKKFVRHYKTDFSVAQDYRLFLDSLESGCLFHNIPDVIQLCRIHQISVSSLQASTQKNNIVKASWDFLSTYYPDLNHKYKEIHGMAIMNILPNNIQDLILRLEWYEKLNYLNLEKPLVDKLELEYKLGERLFKDLCVLTHKEGLRAFFFYVFRMKRNIKSFKIGLTNTFIFLMDCILKRKSTYLS